MTAVDFSAHVTNPLAAGPAAAAATASTTGEGFTFHDLLDIVNPLQHIPVVSTIYRAITGDQIKTFPKIAGDTLFGGVTGFLSSVADTIFEKITGKSVGDTVLAWVEDEISPTNTTATAIAAVRTRRHFRHAGFDRHAQRKKFRRPGACLGRGSGLSVFARDSACIGRAGCDFSAGRSDGGARCGYAGLTRHDRYSGPGRTPDGDDAQEHRPGSRGSRRERLSQHTHRLRQGRGQRSPLNPLSR